MTYLHHSIQKQIFSGFFVITIILFTSSIAFASTISGIVYDNYRNPLIEVDVELLDDYYRLQNRVRTDGSGRYEFDGLSDGRYTIRVLPFNYDLQDLSYPIEINTINIKGTQGVTFINQDFYLAPKKGGLVEAELGVIFAQDIPSEAKKLYENGVNDLSKKRKDEGMAELRKAIDIFPAYYLALHRLGKELFVKGEYGEAAQRFIKAIEVNSKSATSLYYLGSCLNKLGTQYNKAAIAALNQAYILAPSSTQVLYVLGKVEREEGDFTNAEKYLLLAKKSSKVPVPEIHSELAQLYANDLKKFDEAADELESYMKASKLSGEQSKKLKKTISDLREKAKTQN